MGTMGWIPGQNRETICFAVEYNEKLILLDLGTGISRFSTDTGKNILSRYNNIIILLSHFHLDHLIGFVLLPHYFMGKNVILAAPGEIISGFKILDVLNRLCSPPLSTLTIDKFPMNLEIVDLYEGNNNISGISVKIKPQRHAGPSVGIRIDEEIAYVTDTIADDETEDFASNVRLLIHESWFDGIDYEKYLENENAYPEANFHSFSRKVAQIASNANAGLLALTHLNPNYSEERYRQMLADVKTIFPNTIIPVDLSSFEINII